MWDEKAELSSIRFSKVFRPPIGGFTLIELVAVIILLGILSVVVLPRFLSKDSFTEYAVRDQIIAGARMAQQRAMYDHSSGICYRLSINAGAIRVQRFDGTSYATIGPSSEWLNGIAIEEAVVTDSDGDEFVYFNGLGSPLDSTADCAGSVAEQNIQIVGASTVGVRIYETGYIQAQP